MQVKYDVLDHGYVEIIEPWGEGREKNYDWPDYEKGIIEAARQSTQGSFRGWDQDQRLLEFLYNNKHASPFEFAGMTIEVQAPIFVFREWHRHRTQSYNEMSARYSPLPDLYYRPDPAIVRERALAATKNKQAGAAGQYVDESGTVEGFLDRVNYLYTQAETIYQVYLDAGIPKELARIVMPVGHYSRMRASANLRNWLVFLTLRMDPAAQWEIRQFANAVGSLVESTFPRTWKLFAANNHKD